MLPFLRRQVAIQTDDRNLTHVWLNHPAHRQLSKQPD